MAEEEDFIEELEELDEIDYFEIVSLEEIVKLIPTFVAFSNEEIYNYLFSFFKSKSKADSFLNLFISIIERQKKKANTNNFIVIADAKRGWFMDDEEEEGEGGEEEEIKINRKLNEFIAKIKSSNKEGVLDAYKNKNKIWFPLIYDNESSKIKFSSTSKTVIDLGSGEDKYIIFREDERDIPVLGVYFYEPVVLDDDYLNEKIVSFLKNRENNKHKYKSGDNYKTFDDLINDYENEMKLPLDKIDEDEYHYQNINSLFKKFNKDLDFINDKDFSNLKKHLEELIKKEKEFHSKYLKVKDIKPTNLKNNRFDFFKSMNSLKKLSDITINTSSKLKELYDKYKTELTEVDYFPIVKDLGVLITNINEANYEEVIKNIRSVRKNLIIANSLDFLKKILKLEEIEEIINVFQKLEEKYSDIFKITFTFKSDEAEIIKGNNIDNYEGVPVIIDNYKKIPVIDNDNNEDEDEDDDNDNDDEDEDEKKTKIVKYSEFKSYYFNLEKGYSEALKIVLPFISKIQSLSKLPINYDLITTHLFNIYRGIPEKEMIIREKIKGDYNDSYYKELASKTIKYVLTTDNENAKVKEANIEYMKIIIDMIYTTICKWAILTQNDVLTDNLLFIRDKCYLGCIELWNDYGAPYDMNSKDGIIYYLICVFKDVYKEEFSENDNNYLELDKEYKKIIIEKLKNNYSEELAAFNSLGIKKKKENKGLEAGKKLIEILNTKDKKVKTDKLLDTFIEALVYMPSYKYQKIHKYLLGCCLEQIDENFTADTFINKERRDLKKAKSKYASDRVLNNKRSKRFYLIKYVEPNKDLDVFREISNNVYYKNFYDKSLEEWFNDMNKNSKTILSVENLKEIKDNLRKTYLIHTDNYINNFFSKILLSLIKSKTHSYSFNNYQQILRAISMCLYTHLKEESIIFINNINETIKELDKLSSIINDDNITDIIQIRSIIIIRAMCLPSFPSINEKAKLVPRITITQELSRLITSDINKKVINIINSSKIPTPEEQLNYINKIREENKDKILATLNKKSREEKDIIKELKKFGLEIKDEDDNKEINKEKIEIEGDEPENTDEYKLGMEDEIDDDDLDNEDFGFIYAD